MVKARRFSNDGREVGTVDLPADLFEAPVNEHLIWEAVKIYLGNQRQGTAMAKNRALVSGGGRKPFRQKGTGRARAGSNTSPLWSGGGVAFGPRPRDWSARMNRKARRAALVGALSARARDGVWVVEPPALSDPKTKSIAELLRKVGLDGKRVLWIFDRTGETLLRSTRNLARLETTEGRALTPYSLMNCDCLVFTEDGLKSLTERLSP